ncbi:hypothetical protein QQS21_009654 [Conoideocrella luteorostrata]|uniref:FAD dependent oxidoreductase domain-containing protein n=1 Tax=Conoideocrella luteorostrata TaxID=1105319 RepID=A0AAJ0CGI5_9HYPO|nr:hypothetical protein QQS21_009654 [Conoideocrella luteorostrata]
MTVPSSVIIVGSGVFGLSTAFAMSRDDRFANSKITLVDRWNFEPDSSSKSVQNPGAANADTSRVIRRDYPHGPYASLAREAMKHWRADFGKEGRYVNQRLIFSGEGSSLLLPKRQGDTVNYIKTAYGVSCEMTEGGKDALKVLDSLNEIRVELGSHTTLPDTLLPEEKKTVNTLRGYISEDCGWANAGASIEWLRQEVIRLGRVQFHVGHVDKLNASDDGQRILGVQLEDGSTLEAELTIVAAGSQTAHILGIPKFCDVYSEVAAYIQLSQAECDELRRRNWPLIVNAHRGVFSVGPDHDNCIKLGHFSYSGMADVLKDAQIKVKTRVDASGRTPEQIWTEDPKYGFGGDVTISQLGDVVDYESHRMLKTLADFRLFLLELLGPSGLEGVNTLDHSQCDVLLNNIANRPFTRVRKCWYNDTPTLDFIVDYHPSYDKSLFIATGGCDHAFKFLPIIGEKVTALALHHRGVKSDALTEATPSLGDLVELWKFPAELIQ